MFRELLARYLGGTECADGDGDAVHRTDGGTAAATASRGTVAEALREEIASGAAADADLAALRTELVADQRDAAVGDEVPGSVAARLDHLQSRVETVAAYTDALEAFLDEEGSAEEVLAALRDDVAAVEREQAAIRRDLEAASADRAALRERVAALEDELEAEREWRSDLAGALRGTDA